MSAVAERDILEGSADKLVLHTLTLALTLTHPREAKWVKTVRIAVD